jgi:hypothetical protein
MDKQIWLGELVPGSDFHVLFLGDATFPVATDGMQCCMLIWLTHTTDSIGLL